MVVMAMLIGGLRWPNCLVEAARTRDAGEMTLDPPPVFIVGHWRSGTTLLHNILSRDPAYCFPRLIDVLSPYEFFPSVLERFTHPLIFGLLPPTRPMDALPIDPEMPQEEELAMAAMGAASFFNCLYFPEHFEEIFRGEVLMQASGGPALLEEWCRAYRHYLGKIALRYPDRRLLLKNPANSARVRILRKLYPGAKFIHIHRHPHDVFASMTKLYRLMLPILALQGYDEKSISAKVLRGYVPLMTALLDDCAALPSSDLSTVTYAELAERPMDVVEHIYRDLDMPLSVTARESIKEFLSHTPVSAAPTVPLPADIAKDLHREWASVFHRLNYS